MTIIQQLLGGAAIGLAAGVIAFFICAIVYR